MAVTEVSKFRERNFARATDSIHMRSCDRSLFESVQLVQALLRIIPGILLWGLRMLRTMKRKAGRAEDLSAQITLFSMA